MMTIIADQSCIDEAGTLGDAPQPELGTDLNGAEIGDESHQQIGDENELGTDTVKFLAETLQVLVPGGRVAVAVWESLENPKSYPEEVAL